MIQNNKVTIRNLVIFTIVTLASGWIGIGINKILNQPTSMESLGTAIWIATPAIFAIILRIFAKDGWKDFWIKPHFKENARWYLIAFFTYPVTTFFILLFGYYAGLITIPVSAWSIVANLSIPFIIGLPLQLFKNLFEEFAWRGYLAPKIYGLGLDNFKGHILVGFIWGAWHIPYFMFFLDRNYLSLFTNLNMGLFIPLAIIITISWAIVYGEILLATRSVWPAVLMHAVEDAFTLPLIDKQFIKMTHGAEWFISPNTGLISAIIFIAVGLWLRKLRLNGVKLRFTISSPAQRSAE